MAARPAQLNDIVVVKDQYGAAWTQGAMSHNPMAGHNAFNALGNHVAEAAIGNYANGDWLGGIITSVGGALNAEFYRVSMAPPLWNQVYTYLGSVPVVQKTVKGQAIWQVDLLKGTGAMINGDPTAPAIFAVQDGVVRSGMFFPAGTVHNIAGSNAGEVSFNNQALTDILTNFVNP